MKKLLLIALAIVGLWQPAKADEGMWLLPFLKQNNIENMQAKGLKLSAEEIYSINQNSLKDAIVIFGRGCTGEIVSDQGLLLTNHHCGYGNIQAHSTIENDYLKNGFWAMNLGEELPTPGLTVVFIRQVVDVTDQVLAVVKPEMNEQERTDAIKQAIEKITADNLKADENISAQIVPMFGGNQYLMFIRETFGDIRMVGAPPSSIGKFGGETDNWMWPRHTGDFSVFRVYASKDNKSTAGYNADNRPYKPAQHLKVSLKGYEQGDYAMIMGFPGRTNRYMTTWEIDQTLQQDNPTRIYIRGERQKIMWQQMMASDKVRIQYSDKYAISSNYWKNSIGMSRGLKRLNVRDKKQAGQDEFTAWVNADKQRQAKYGNALSDIEKAVAGRRPIQREMQYLQECMFNIETIPFALSVMGVMRQRISPEEQTARIKEIGEKFFKDYDKATDRLITPRMLEIFMSEIHSLDGMFDGKTAAEISEELFATSIFVDQAKFNEFAANPSMDVLTNDKALKYAMGTSARYMTLQGEVAPFTNQFSQGHRTYLAGLLEMNQGKKAMYPDANFTQRLTYGQILPYWAADAVFYEYYTTLSGVMAKEDPEKFEFQVPARLRQLWEAKDFGRYAYNGDVPVAFLSNNDITGGNSGSPIMNANGELIGLAFDGNWEAMSGDIAFEPNVQRTINVDIRYVLFVIDKFAGAKHLVDEMTIVQ